MRVSKKHFLVVTLFLSIFFMKMVISVAPVFVNKLDKNVINNVIMQVEVEHGENETGKTLKFDFKSTDQFQHYHSYTATRYHLTVRNSFIEHSKRYVNPFHPSVPTPPPNCA